METNTSYVKNEPTVGMNFFENIPPVGQNESGIIQWIRPIGLPNTNQGMSRQRQQNSNKDCENPVVKGFGSTALFTFGLLATAGKSGHRIRLDDDTGKQQKLCNAEEICKRNYTTLKEYYNEGRIYAANNDNRPLQYHDLDNLMVEELNDDEIFASDYSSKKKGWKNEVRHFQRKVK